MDCFDLELDTVASLPEGDLKSMKCYGHTWLSLTTTVARELPLQIPVFKSTNLGANFKENKTYFCQYASMTPPLFASSSLLVIKVQTSTEYLKNET